MVRTMGERFIPRLRFHGSMAIAAPGMDQDFNCNGVRSCFPSYLVTGTGALSELLSPMITNFLAVQLGSGNVLNRGNSDVSSTFAIISVSPRG